MKTAECGRKKGSRSAASVLCRSGRFSSLADIFIGEELDASLNQFVPAASLDSGGEPTGAFTPGVIAYIQDAHCSGIRCAVYPRPYYQRRLGKGCSSIHMHRFSRHWQQHRDSGTPSESDRSAFYRILLAAFGIILNRVLS